MHNAAAKKRILIVEDDDDILELLKITLSAADFLVETSNNGNNIPGLIKTLRPDMILLDLMLPGISGLNICKALRADPATSALPVIMLTARNSETDRVRGLEMGADDYVAKPFSPRELVLRIKAVLRREDHRLPAADALLTAGNISIDEARHRVFVGRRELSLTATEFKLLSALLREKGRVLDREQLLSGVWADIYDGCERTVDTHIRRLRKKLGSEARMIETVRGSGYRFSDRF